MNQEIDIDELTGILGRLLDEVEMPNDIHDEVQDLYFKAVKIQAGNQ